MQRTRHPPEPEFLDVNAVAERYRISTATVWNWLDQGRLPQPIRFSAGCSRWRLETLKKWDAELEAEAATRTAWEQKRRKRLQDAEA